MAGISSKALQFGEPENKYKYNGIEVDENFNLNVATARYRNLDFQVGRWWQIDPKVDSFLTWSPYNLNFNDPVKYSDPLGDDPILRALAKKGIEWASRTVKGAFKPISREQALNILKNKGSVHATGDNQAKNAKKLMKEAADGEKNVRHDGHTLSDGVVGKDHYQKKAGDGPHVFYSLISGLISGGNEEIESSPTTPSRRIIKVIQELTESQFTSSAVTDIIGKTTGLNNAGKKMLGDNIVGRFVDNWLNPFN
jgi:RHS repeat-associated protein